MEWNSCIPSPLIVAPCLNPSVNECCVVQLLLLTLLSVSVQQTSITNMRVFAAAAEKKLLAMIVNTGDSIVELTGRRLNYTAGITIASWNSDSKAPVPPSSSPAPSPRKPARAVASKAAELPKAAANGTVSSKSPSSAAAAAAAAVAPPEVSRVCRHGLVDSFHILLSLWVLLFDVWWLPSS